MFVGHFAPALVAATRPRAPGLGTLFVAAQLVDIGFAALLIPGVEAMRVVPGITAMNPMDLYHMPYTHSLLGALLWGAAFGALVGAITRRREAALLTALVVVSHWFVDLIVHIPDLTFYGAPPKFGFGLWNYPLAEMPLEIGLTAAAMIYYARRTSAPTGNRRLWILGGLLAAVQAVDWFGAKAPDYSIEIPLTMLAAYIVLALVAAWAGANRAVVMAQEEAST
ncbi:MAG: hypothetical protein BGO58_12535 [Sphingopyxis sp. 65-8]|uniref:hypothetical protein n=1 Tax=Sphingopyxis terrae TaxID=33052 RepID=UPI000788677E|nr:hypothetical protein [Sphingopyxis terrae]MBN8803642.1 hypothetical protein [Sphingopyxis terrae]OJW23859.1 MAG: hypothetical protein BGO58_12535 [Sphingopyxis sp. 65-8]HRE33992.1 hypothetical protein [Sphingopyxis terrae]